MSLNKPFFLTFRPNKEKGADLYMHDDRYAKDRWQIRKNVELLYKDFETLFEFIEPCDDNKVCFSLRTYELFLRTCTEVESNMKMILLSNGYQKKGGPENLNMSDYCKLNATHFLSSFEVHIPNWKGELSIVSPFNAWSHGTTKDDILPWYAAYNTVKHNRQEKFHEASLIHAVEAFCGLLVLLAAQFFNEEFAETSIGHSYGYYDLDDGLSDSIGSPFRIKFPDYSDEDIYNFKWEDIKGESEPYAKLHF